MYKVKHILVRFKLSDQPETVAMLDTRDVHGPLVLGLHPGQELRPDHADFLEGSPGSPTTPDLDQLSPTPPAQDTQKRVLTSQCLLITLRNMLTYTTGT